jgi:hypothetical protein
MCKRCYSYNNCNMYHIVWGQAVPGEGATCILLQCLEELLCVLVEADAVRQHCLGRLLVYLCMVMQRH